MPYIPPSNRPPIDEVVDQLAKEIADAMAAAKETSELGSRLRSAFMTISRHIRDSESGTSPAVGGKAQALAQRVLDVATSYGIKGGWTGELNYAVTRLIQAVQIGRASCRERV